MHEALTSDSKWKLLVTPHHAQMVGDSIKWIFFEAVLRENVPGLGPFWTGWGATAAEAIADAFRVKQAEEDRKMVYN
jgi:hypothetical protein